MHKVPLSPPRPRHQVRPRNRPLCRKQLTRSRSTSNSPQTCPKLAKSSTPGLYFKDVIPWTSMITGYVNCQNPQTAVDIFSQMVNNSYIDPNAFTISAVVKACSQLRYSTLGLYLHGVVESRGFRSSDVIVTALIDRTILRACAGLVAVQHGKEVHCQYVRRCGWRDVKVESALVNLYAKCGCVDFACSVFAQMQIRNLITWNSMICGFGQNGQGDEALGVFEEMIKEGKKPYYISFIGVLFACSHVGLVDQGRNFFNLMTKEYGIKPGIEHYCCMVDLLGRAGLLEEAENIIESADCSNDSSLWAVLLGASTTSTDSVTAERIAKKMIELEPDCHLSYVLLANVYRAVGRWDDAMKIGKLMQDRGVKKTPARSWFESNCKLSLQFPVGNVHTPRKD